MLIYVNYYDFTYDSLDRITQKRYNGDNSKRVTYLYGNNGNVAQITDYYTNTNTRFVYDLADRIVSQREYTGTKTSGGTLRSSTDYTYANKTNYLTGVKHFSPLGTQTIGYRYGNLSNGQMPDCIYGVTWNGKEKVSYTYDGLGRLTDKKTGSFNTTYSYPDIGATRTTTRLRSITTPAGTYTYNYDNIGNIKTADDGTYKTSYVYDELNQLVRVNDQKAGKSYTYTYINGNITSAKEYAYTAGELGEALSTKTWNYTDSVWKDLLTDYNGEAITYDTIGNPLTIGSKEFSWNGRQLAQLTNGDNTTVYAYNGDGQRISKTVNGTKTEYYYNGSILAGEKTGNNTIIFMYDNNGDAFGFTYNGKEYYYIKNAQNDVTAIADSSGKVVANYHYDAWGKLLEISGSNTDIANANPIRYRSYYYDSDTELYYLNTRYYSPDMCRFINADGYVQTGQGVLDKNMFAYCLNNSINRTDSNGTLSGLAMAAVAALVKMLPVIILVTTLTVCCYALTQPQVMQGMQSAVNAISNSVSNTVSKAKEKSAEKRKAKDSDQRVHHIVAKAAWRAAPAREVLRSVEINPTTAPENLITISHGLHKSMHTKTYYDYVNAKLEPCTNTAEVEAALLEIRADIEYAEATGVKRWDIS